jgi:site-specific DNA-methyltransferase (adenine-specific)
MTTENGQSVAPLHPIVLPPFAPYYADEAVTIYNADCRKILPFLGAFDLLLTDPPYGLGSKLVARPDDKEWGKHCGVQHQWDVEIVDNWLLHQCVSKASKAIVWGGNYYELPPTRCWLSWDKMQDHTSGHFEMAWTNLDKPTRTFRMSRVEAHSNGKRHPTEKPLGLMKWCIGLAGDEVQTILDPFAGSGTTGHAAKMEGRKAVLIEAVEEYCEKAADRLRQGVLF